MVWQQINDNKLTHLADKPLLLLSVVSIIITR